MNIAPYTYLNSERLRFGKFPVLDMIMYRWARKIEETLFELAGVEIYAGSSVVEEIKFSAFHATLKQPRPIYFFRMEPFFGTGLFVVDNRFTAFCLREAPGKQHRIGIADAPNLSPGNHREVQRIVQALMRDFDQSWWDIHEVRIRLKKVTTYPFRARIMNPYELCLVAQIHLSGRNVSSRLTWCFPRTLFDPVMAKIRQNKVLPPLALEKPEGGGMDREQLMKILNYRMKVKVGQMELSALASEGLSVGKVVPLESLGANKAILEVEGLPVYLGSVGEVQGRYAVKIEETYSEPVESSPIVDGKAFQSIGWPAAEEE